MPPAGEWMRMLGTSMGMMANGPAAPAGRAVYGIR